ncbi:EamA family transporter RarD [Solicola gregarius]|uniref:EamA family transporter RarD n=1 Tax=Solicola gregarius TaxID=2908642 RepID=A0AA46TEG2_9ACTN|nr:EamA family transporter RarD [Solicola gregarius]UYM03693.1 EamA family transporter RarD [Solicola gregarius]
MKALPVDEARRGFVFGAAAYTIWGFFPLYFPLLEPAGPVEILSHRVIWSLALVAAVLTVLRKWRSLREVVRSPRRLGLLSLAAVFIAANWGVYIYGVNSGHVVETSLGYFINPLVTILMGVVLLGERLRTLQWCALALAFGAVIELGIDYGRPPYISLCLAFSFATYGLLKKKVGVGALEGLGLETLVLAPLALAYLAFLDVEGTGSFGHRGIGNALLLVMAGVLTAIPLLLFAGAANRVTMTMLGLLQYVTPTLQFLLGIFVFHEAMTSARWVGFALVWTALAIITVEGISNRQRLLRKAAKARAQ